jgi:hypothetical protein
MILHPCDQVGYCGALVSGAKNHPVAPVAPRFETSGKVALLQ